MAKITEDKCNLILLRSASLAVAHEAVVMCQVRLPFCTSVPAELAAVAVVDWLAWHIIHQLYSVHLLFYGLQFGW